MGVACFFAGMSEGELEEQQGAIMVKLHIKNEDRSQFLTVEVPVAELVLQLVRLYNGRLKVDRPLCQGCVWCALFEQFLL